MVCQKQPTAAYWGHPQTSPIKRLWNFWTGVGHLGSALLQGHLQPEMQLRWKVTKSSACLCFLVAAAACRPLPHPAPPSKKCRREDGNFTSETCCFKNQKLTVNHQWLIYCWWQVNQTRLSHCFLAFPSVWIHDPVFDTFHIVTFFPLEFNCFCFAFGCWKVDRSCTIPSSYCSYLYCCKRCLQWYD